MAWTPAWWCPHAAHTLQWGILPDRRPAQGWTLRRADGRVVGTLDGYPAARPAIGANEARAWAETLGAAPRWVERPPRSSAWHTHSTPRITCPPWDRGA